MTESLVLTVLGDDRPGLVESLSGIIVAHDGEWVDSRMAVFAGKFAGILLVQVPESQAAALTTALQTNQELSALVEKAEPTAIIEEAKRDLALELVGLDRPGIVHQISQALARMDINVDELETGVFDASMSGERMFKAAARLRIPQDAVIDEIRAVLEGLANELMVDIELD